MIYLTLLSAFLLGLLVHALKVSMQKVVTIYKEDKTELAYINKLCQQGEQLNSSLQLNIHLLKEKRRLERRVSELQAQHEKTLAVFN